MSKKPAELSSSLVAIKGQATPAADMPGRLQQASQDQQPGNEKPRRGGEGGTAKEREELLPLNFRIPASFHREFKVYAATHGLKLNELLKLCFDEYRSTNTN
jgi:hypothetical protein